MGGWSPYCPLCGMQLASPSKYFLNDDDNKNGMVWSLEKYKPNPNKITKKKGTINTFIYVEDNPIIQAPKDFIKITDKANWMDKLTLLMPNLKPQHGYIESKGNIWFTKKNAEDQENIEYPGDGLALHTDCWKLAKEKKTLTYDCFNYNKCIIEPSTIGNNEYWSHYLFKYLNYSPAKQYHEQYFNIHKLATKPQHWYLLGSPLKDTPDSIKNRQRIEKNIIKTIASVPKKPFVIANSQKQI